MHSIEKIENLKEFKIGVTQGYSYGQKLDEAIKNKKIKVRVANKDELNLLKLAKKRIDAFPIAKMVGIAMIEKLKEKYPKNKELSSLTFNNRPVHTSDLYLLFSKNRKNKGIVKKFNKGIKLIREKGLYKKILSDAAKGTYSK